MYICVFGILISFKFFVTYKIVIFRLIVYYYLNIYYKRLNMKLIYMINTILFK